MWFNIGLLKAFKARESLAEYEKEGPGQSEQIDFSFDFCKRIPIFNSLPVQEVVNVRAHAPHRPLLSCSISSKLFENFGDAQVSTGLKKRMVRVGGQGGPVKNPEPL